MNTETYGVLTFKSTNYTIQAEEVFKEEGLSYKIIPTPREITLSCGLAIVFSLDDKDKAIEMSKNGTINISNIYKYTKDGKVNHVEKLY